MFSPGQGLSETAVSLTGSSAVDWLVQRGMNVGGNANKARIEADALRSSNFAIIRLWINSQQISQQAAQAGGVVVSIATEGPLAVLITDDQQYVLNKGDAAIIPKSFDVTMRADSSIGLMQIHLKPEFLTRFALRDVKVVRVARANVTPVLILASLVNSTLTTLNYMEVSTANSKTAVEASAATVFAKSEIENRVPSMSGSRLYDNALLIIYDCIGDPQFSVVTLASMMSISKRRLQEIFAAHGESPSEIIRRLRLQAAVQMLSRYPSADSAKFAEIARISGYRNSRALRDALRGRRGNSDDG